MRTGGLLTVKPVSIVMAWSFLSMDCNLSETCQAMHCKYCIISLTFQRRRERGRERDYVYMGGGWGRVKCVSTKTHGAKE